MKAKKISLCAMALAIAASLTRVASASLEVTPIGPGLIATGTQTSQAQIDTAIASFIGSAIELYKQNVGQADQGTLAGSYSTVFANSPGDPADFTTTYGSGPSLGDPSYLLVKDGNQTPAWYLFDISAWDGTSVLSGTGFWPNQGAISHIALYGSIAGVPEAGTLLVWGGLAAISTVAVRRRRLPGVVR